MLENPSHGGHWLGLRLEGTRSNRSAIGARIAVTIDQSGGEPRVVHQWVNSGTSFGDAPFERHFGLAAARTVRQVVIVWPSDARQTFTNLPADMISRIREGDLRALPSPAHAFRLRHGAHQHE